MAAFLTNFLSSTLDGAAVLLVVSVPVPMVSGPVRCGTVWDGDCDGDWPGLVVAPPPPDTTSVRGGGTDNKGHVVEFAYALRTRWLLNFRYFLNERGEDVGRTRDYNRLQADVMFNY